MGRGPVRVTCCGSVESLGSAPPLKILEMMEATKLASGLPWQCVSYLIETEGNHGSGQEVAMSGPGVSVVHMPRDAHRTTWLCLNAQHCWLSKWVPLPGEGAYTENLLTMPFVGPHPWPTETLGIECSTCIFISPPGDSDAWFCLRVNGIDKRSTNTFL